MSDTTQQQTTTPTPEGTGGRMFTQDEVNKIVSDRLARERERLAEGDEYKVKYENVLAELNGLKAAQLRQRKEDAYRALLTDANISERLLPTVLRASKAEIDALELDESGKIVGADKALEAIKTDWADFVVHTEVRGADTPNPPTYWHANDDDTRLRDAFKPKI